MGFNLHGNKSKMHSWMNGQLNINHKIKIMVISKKNGKIMENCFARIKSFNLH